MPHRPPALLLMTTAFLLTATAATAQDADATVTVVHGIPDTTADLWVDGELVLDDLGPGVTDPFAIAAGDHVVALTAPNAADASSPVREATVTLEPSSDVSLVAHLDGAGDVQLASFVNDTSSLPADMARLTVRHVAAAGAADVVADGDVAGTLEAGSEWVGEVPAGSHDLALVAGDEELASMPGTELSAGTNTIAHGIGSPMSGSFDVLVQTVALQDAEEADPEPTTSPTDTPSPETSPGPSPEPSPQPSDETTPAEASGPEDPPTSVPAGTGGLVDTERPMGVILALLVVMAAALATRRRLSRPRP